MRAAVTRVVVAGSAALLLVAALSACQPRFPAGGTLEVTSEGAGLRLSWPAASADADKQISTYRVDVDGVEVARLEAWATTCLLGGLAPGSSHQVSVTAYDSAGQW